LRRILIALDQSDQAVRIARYVAEALGGRKGLEVTLFHAIHDFMPIHEGEFDLGVLPEVQARFEESSRRAIAGIFSQVKDILLETGLPEANIKTEIKSAAGDVAHEILSEAEAGDYDTIVLGRRGMGRVRQFFIGSVSHKVVQHAAGRTVWVVE
jgi:nucleotide-binding universal stress UspA family protein